MSEMGTDTSSEQLGQKMEAEVGQETAEETVEQEASNEPEITHEVSQEQDGEDDEDQEQEHIKRLPPKAQEKINKRFQRMTAEREAAREEARIAREERAKLLGQIELMQGIIEPPQAPQPAPAQAQIPSDPIMPLREHYPDDATYQMAFGTYSQAMVNRNMQMFQERQKQEAAKAQAQKEFDEAIYKVDEAGTKEFPDFMDVVGKGKMPMTPVLADAILKSGDVAHKVQYNLAKNKDELKRILSLSPAMMHREIAILEHKIRSAKTAPKTTNTPPPVTTVKGSTALTVDEDSMTDAEYYRHEQAKKLARIKKFA